MVLLAKISVHQRLKPMPVRHRVSDDNYHAVNPMGETPMPRYGPTKGRDAQGTWTHPDVAWVSRPCDYLFDCYRYSEDALQALALTANKS